MIKYKNNSDLEGMTAAGKILGNVFKEIRTAIKVGVSCSYLDDMARRLIRDFGAEPGFLGYRGYKYSTCISKNEEVVHGIPYSDKILFPGDICSIDIGVKYKGYYADAARTFMVDQVDPLIHSLVTVTRDSFFEALKYAYPGNRIGDVSSALQTFVESNGFSVVRDLYSHGIGTDLHEDPLIPNFGVKGQGFKLKSGFSFALEPMVNVGTFEVLTLEDKWTIITADSRWSAHYENTVFITETGPLILTNGDEENSEG